jgi:TolB protein
MKILKLLFLIIALNLYSSRADATLNITIKDENLSKTKILFIGFEANNFSLNNEAKQILQKIIYNLKTTNLVEPLVQNSISQISISPQINETNSSTAGNLNQNTSQPTDFIDINAIPDFDKYYNSGIEGLVMAQFSYDAIGNLETRVRMWDALDRKQTFGKFYSSTPENYRKTANLLSDEIYKSITGEALGYFNSQIVYTSETGTYRKRIKKITTIDFDGENYKNLTDGSEMVLTPIFSKRRDEIYYLRYFQGRPQIFLLNTKTLRSQKVGGFRGTTLAPNVNPKTPDRILLTAIEDGNSDIHEFNIAQNFAKKLTKSPAIDTTASYSPDGNSVVFISDRNGSQQIYIMNIENLSLTKISNGEGSYSKPMWSPDGKSIAFTKQKNGKFFIGTMNINGKAEKLLTSAYLVEGARWSPSGRHLIYSKKRSQYGLESIPRIFIIDILTGHENEIQTPPNEGATDPDWLQNF